MVSGSKEAALCETIAMPAAIPFLFGPLPFGIRLRGKIVTFPVSSSCRACGDPPLVCPVQTVSGPGGGCVGPQGGSTNNGVASEHIDSASLLSPGFDSEFKAPLSTSIPTVKLAGVLCGRTGESLLPSTVPFEIVVGIGGTKGASGGLFPFRPLV